MAASMIHAGKKLLLPICFYFIVNGIFAQDTIQLIVLDKSNREPVPYASIAMLSSRTGTSTDMNGKSRFPVQKSDTLLVTSIGFHPKKVAIGNTKIDTIFLDPFVQELQPITVGKRISQGKVVAGITKANIAFSWGPSADNEEFAQLIRIPASSEEIYKVKKVILRASHFSPTRPLLLHIYSVDEKTGFPGVDLLTKKYVMTAKNFKGKKVIIDLDREDLFLDEQQVFVSFEYLGKIYTGRGSTVGRTLLPMTKDFPEALTYCRFLKDGNYTWSPFIMRNLERQNPRAVNTIFSMEIERFK